MSSPENMSGHKAQLRGLSALEEKQEERATILYPSGKHDYSQAGMSVTSSRKSNAEKWLIAARSERQVLRFVEQSLIGYDDTYKKYMDTVWRTTTLSPLLGTSHPTNHPYERDSLEDEINMESKFEWPGNVRRSTPPHNSFKMNMRACARRATAQKGRLAKSEDPKKVTSPRCYDKEHQRRSSSLTEWTWDEHDSNMPCGAPVNPFTQGAAAGHAGAPQAGPPVATAPQPGAEDGIAAVIRRGSSSTPTQATLDGFGAPLVARMDAQATRNPSGVVRRLNAAINWLYNPKLVKELCSQLPDTSLVTLSSHASTLVAQHSYHRHMIFNLNMTRATYIQPGSTTCTFLTTLHVFRETWAQHVHARAPIPTFDILDTRRSSFIMT
ncbi:hypothetical protein M438DRAFT_353874 [Aureobasidium pullulans EXF-150]|uniref:Uncharacterized protein n=1 Tax=Aureobasidium pullulans EXF-150 TaxID=1043002 RepID=A0A074XUT8_AURPU|nr:uncharacterized protein M438DRAFT_353874 [Aureobasidium pullulans EXF-150]KEQ85702.1 hypothetical protein M438DRAFT_353874 [Aureobasidium pullulans EXF-150]